MLDGVFYDPDGEKWKKEARKMPESYESWVDAQIYSKEASELWNNYIDTVFPLEKTRKKEVLNKVWSIIDKVRRPYQFGGCHIDPPQNYQSTSGKDVDDTWGVKDIRHIKPSWHGGARNPDDDAMALVPAGRGKRAGGKAKPLAITNGDESDGSMPSLQTVSESEDPESEYEEDSEDDLFPDEDDSDGGSEEEYDTDEEDDLRDLLREAMDAAVASGDFFDPKAPAPEFDSMAEERKGNPFLKLLGSLRGASFVVYTTSQCGRDIARTYVPGESGRNHRGQG